jgi:hypothetical protein
MLFYCSEHMQKRESNICELDTCSFLRFSLPTNTEPFGVRRMFSPAQDGYLNHSCKWSRP